MQKFARGMRSALLSIFSFAIEVCASSTTKQRNKIRSLALCHFFFACVAAAVLSLMAQHGGGSVGNVVQHIKKKASSVNETIVNQSMWVRLGSLFFFHRCHHVE